MTTHQPNIILPAPDAPAYDTIGARPLRHDGPDKVTGRARYAADIHPPGHLTGKILRSPHAHAIIRHINPAPALAIPGVKAIITAADLPQVSAEIADQAEGQTVNYGFYSRNILAREKALYCGHAIAAIAATTPHIAETALQAIEVDYQILTPVLNANDAMQPNAPILHDRLLTLHNPNLRQGAWSHPADHQPPTNIANRFEFLLGDPETAFAQADLIIEREFHTRPVHQGYIEPHAATAQWSADGTVTIWTSTQGHFALRDHTAAILGLNVSRVKIIPMEIGGGFGGKGQGGCYLEPIAAALSRKSAQPVKIAMTRREVFEGTGPTAATHIRIKLATDNNGQLTAADCTLTYEAGAFPGSPVPSACRTMLAPYQIPNARIQGIDVLVNTQKTAAYRAPGSPPAAFAAESVIDEICQTLNQDPIQFRLRNAAREGTRQPTGPTYRKIGFIETLQAAQDHPHLAQPLTRPHQGRGIAAGAWFNSTGPAAAIASLNPDGTISLIEGSPDIGGSRTAMAMQVAETLGIPPQTVKPTIADTDSIGYSSGAGGSGVTFKTGAACHQAAQDIIHQLTQRAARIWDVPPETVQYHKGTLYHRQDPELNLTLQTIAPRLNATGGPIIGRAAVNPPGVGNAFALHIVDVAVDPETGKITILRYTALQDAGRAIHPSYVEGQIQGGAAQGIGWALNEEYQLNPQGQMLNPTFLDYRMPTALDLPMIDTVIIQIPNPGHPYGVRGAGEVPLVPPLAAIANAISRATNTRQTHLPITPARLLETAPPPTQTHR